MIMNMTGGGGGAALNFKVVPGLTQPVTASENTIWVKTEKIGAWYFSATQPEGLQEWDVWFLVGTESNKEFNALKKNAIQVYPLSAKQYVSGALVDVNVMSYQNSEWVDWFYWLFSSNSNYVGEWVGYAYGPGASYSGKTVMPTKIINSDGTMSVVSPSESLSEGRSIIANMTKIDFSKYKTVYIKAHANGLTAAASSRRLAVVPSVVDHFEMIAVGAGAIVGSEFNVYSVDVEGYNEEGYVIITFYSNKVKNEVVVDSIWLE